jgi:WhiB family redox-sensing transcriptional regulator
MDIALQRSRREWESEALCYKLSQREKENFFPAQRGRPVKEPEWKQVCFNCPVRLECLNYAIVHDEEGNWGGATEKERKSLPRSFVRELRQIAKDAGWFEVHLDPWEQSFYNKSLADHNQMRLQLDWELDSITLTGDQQRSFDLLGFY